ncbi:MAG: protein translocase subunit SecF [Chromatiales bacterium]|jgi:preprotein translocase subunit SecF|nr:protein translocase subunit SecF [Chromatiales bacterium]
MDFFNRITNFDFMGRRRIAGIFSAILMIGSLVLLIPGVRGLNFGIDFTGGVLLELGYQGPANLPDIRERLAGSGFGDAQVQNFGTASDVMIRILPREGLDNKVVSGQILAVLKAGDPTVELRRTEFVGPQVGEELTEQGALAMLFAMIMIAAYIMLRYQWKFALGAILATLHDPIVTLGFFALTGLTFDLSVLAAMLAIVGYSVNDTIVVFDRIRENFRKIRRGEPEQIMNISINETLSRTMMTSFLTMLMVIAMLFFGGETLRGFASALTIGIVIGTYSSIFVASALALALKATAADLMPPKQEKGEGEADSMP